MPSFGGLAKRAAALLLPDAVMDRLKARRWLKRAERARGMHAEAFGQIADDPVVIVFVVYVAQAWNSLKSVYREAERRGDVVPYLVVSPENAGGKLIIHEDVVAYYKGEASGVIDACEGGRLLDLRTLEPDIVFRQTPYDHVYPPQYSARAIAAYAKPCYIPYNYNWSAKKHLEIEYNRPFVIDLYAAFVESDSNLRHCERLKDEMNLDLQVFNLGFPRFDLMREIGAGGADRAVTFLWIPRWSTDPVGNDATGFFAYGGKLVDYFREHGELRLVIRPHQMMFRNFIRTGAMTREEVREFKGVIEALDNVELDESFDYLRSFERSDAMIADHSSLVFEYYLTAKPIMYCGDAGEHNAETESMMNLVYQVDCWGDLRSRIGKLAIGEDERFDERRADASRILEGLPRDVGKAIVSKCVALCKGA